jgi:UDP-glucose:(heptosyl)LPS alpha-1,3-glucosyltransferase
MRLAIVRQRYTPYGGAERFVEGALEALLERGIAITLYTRDWPQTRLQLIEPRLCNPFYIGRLWRDWSFARAVCRAVASNPPELVQSHERLLCCDVYRAGDGVHRSFLDERLGDASPFRRWITEHAPYHRYVMDTERRLFASPVLRAIICNSKMVRDEIRDRFSVAEEKLPVIYNGVDSEAFSPDLRKHRTAIRNVLHIPEQSVVYLLVGSGYERKGVARAIEAIARLPEHAFLVVIGRDKSLSRYKRQARRLGIGHRVALLGPQDDTKPFYGAADVFVLPTLYDPCPNAVLEAMACALPIVTSTKCGAAELVIEHDAGFVCPARDVDALATNMGILLADQARADRGARAREAVLPLTPAAMTLKLALLYRELLAAAYAARTPTPAPPSRPSAPRSTPSAPA